MFIQRPIFKLLCFNFKPQYKKLSSLPNLNIGCNESRSKLNPLEQNDYFDVKNIVKLKDLFDNRVHYGHKIGTLNEKMKPYIYGNRLGHLIIDLDLTLALLYDALNIIAHIAYQKGVILFLCRNYQHIHAVERFAAQHGAYSHCRFWSGGVFTNAESQFNFQLPGQEVAPSPGSINASPLRFNPRLPDLCVFLGAQNTQFAQHRAIRDAAKLNIPTVAVVDTDSDPTNVTYPVPGNDDSKASIDLYLKCFGEAIRRAQKYRAQRDSN